MNEPSGSAGPWRALRSLKLGLALFFALAALATVGTFTAVDVYGSPPFLFLAGLLALNIAFCSVHRGLRRARGAAGQGAAIVLDLLVHLSLLVILAGGVAKGVWGFIGAQYLFPGLAEGKVRDFSTDEEGPLGFSLLLKERRDEFYPLRARIGLRERESGEKVGATEVIEGGRASLGPVTITFTSFDRPRGEVVVRARAGEGEREVRLAVSETGAGEASIGPHDLVLIAYREDLRQVRGLIAVLEEGREVKEQWLAVNARLAHKGTSVFLTGWGSDPYGNEYLTIQISRDPGAPLFWTGCVLLGLSLPLFLARRARRKRGS